MTTTHPNQRLAAPAARARRSSGSERHRSRVAAMALAAGTVLVLPATAVLEGAPTPGSAALVAGTFCVVAALEVVVGWQLHGLLRDRAQSAAYAMLVSRAGYAVLLTAAAGRLLWPGGDGVAGFRADRSSALVVLGVHLLVAAVALWHSRRVPGAVVAGTALAGTASVLSVVVDLWPVPDVLPGAGVLLPGTVGALVLLGWLVPVGWGADGR